MTEQPENAVEPAGEEPAEAPGGSFHFAEYVPVPGFGAVFRFMRLHMRLYKGAIEAPGYVAGGIRAKWWRKQFWTYWVWDSQEAMRDYVASEPAATLLREMHALAGPGACNTEWESAESPSWDEALKRLENPKRYLVPPLWQGFR